MFTVPDQTSTYAEEFTRPMYTISFAPELVGFILENRKLTTYRYGTKYDYLQVGDEVAIQNAATKELVARATIKRKTRTTFGELPVKAETHESYKDKEHQRQVLSGYYAYIGRPLEDDDLFLVFDFELVGTLSSAS